MNRRDFIKHAWMPTMFGIYVPSAIALPPVFSPGFIRKAPAAAGGGGGCTTPRDTDGGSGTPNDRTTDGVKWYGQRFVAGANYDLCKIELLLGKAGTPAGDINVHLYSHDATGNGIPDASLGSTTIAFADISTTVGTETATFSVAGVTSGTTYWVVVNDPQGGVFSGSYLIWRDFSTGAGGANHQVFATDGTDWAEFNNNTRFTYTTYS